MTVKIKGRKPTQAELIEYEGLHALLVVASPNRDQDLLLVPVTILAAKWCYGRTDFQITPIGEGASGVQWVAEHRLEFIE